VYISCVAVYKDQIVVSFSHNGVGCRNGGWWKPGLRSFTWKETEKSEGVKR